MPLSFQGILLAVGCATQPVSAGCKGIVWGDIFLGGRHQDVEGGGWGGKVPREVVVHFLGDQPTWGGIMANIAAVTAKY